MDLKLENTENDFLNRAIAFSKSAVAPNAQSWEDARQMPVDTMRAAAGTGIVGLEIPEEYGGFAGRFKLKARVAEEIARDCFAFSFSLINNMGLAGKIARDAPVELAVAEERKNGQMHHLYEIVDDLRKRLDQSECRVTALLSAPAKRRWLGGMVC